MPSREASLQNLAKARLRWRRPRPWRSYSESRLIPHLRMALVFRSRAVVLRPCAGPMAWRQSHLHSEAHADATKKRE
jgi:hypothetical protein